MAPNILFTYENFSASACLGAAPPIVNLEPCYISESVIARK